MNNIFLDCGSNLGQGYDKFSNYYNIPTDITVYMFEPNNTCIPYLKDKYPTFKIYNVAVWNKKETRTLNIEYCPYEGKLTGGATNILQDNHKIINYIKTENMHQWPPKYPQEINCIDFSQFIKTNFKEDDNIYLKMDIEGAEYEVLEKMINDNTLKYIKYMTIEWHFHMRQKSIKDQQYFENEIQKCNINYHNQV